ncbi:MAG: TonB-dependent receptor [Alphaproteobacteria bacterium]|nr:TonB-dependent receptor [Alphaproteobacteria bacterium]
MKMSRRVAQAALTVFGGAFVVSAGQAFAQETTNEEIVVIGYRAQNAQAIEAKRENDTIADYLSADDIGSQPDYNISDAIRRVPGVQTVFDEDEGKFVSIRGLNPSYTLGALDGATLATSERQNRQVNFEAIPSGAIRQVVVTKARTPDVDGNAIGGTLNLVTRSPFDAGGFYLAGAAEVGVSTDTDVPGEGFGRDYDDAPNWRLDATMSNRFGDRGQFGVLVGVNYLQRNRDQQRLLPQIVPAGISATPTPASSLGPTDLLWSNYPNTIERYGGMVKLEWEPIPALRTGVSFIHYRQDDNELRQSQRLRNQTGNNASFVRFNDFPLEKPTTAAQAFVTWEIDSDQMLRARASYSEAQFLEPSNQVQFNLENPAATFDLALEGEVPVATTLDPRLLDPANYVLANNTFTPYEDDSDEYVEQLAFDYGFNTESGDQGWGLGFGVSVREIVRDNDRTDWTWTFSGAPLRLSQFVTQTSYTPIYADFQQMFVDYEAFDAFFNQNAAQFTGGRSESPQSDWTFDEDVVAFYGLARHAGPRHRLIIGGRFEDTKTSVERNRTAGAVQTRVTREGQYDNFLPSATLSYDISESLRLRAAAFRAIGRPNPSQLASGETVNQTTGAINRGNPDLQAREGDSYEAAIEYYMPGDSGVLSVGVFRKEIENEIVTRLTPAAGPNGEDITQPVNVTSADVSGVELNVIINELPLPGFLSNFGISANATFIDGESDTGGARGVVDFLQGQSDTLFNFALFYEDGPFRARVAYAYIGEAITSASSTDATGLSDRYDRETNTVDLQARYTISDNFELIGEVRNATNEDKVNLTGADIYRDVSEYGRQIWFGTTFRY